MKPSPHKSAPKPGSTRGRINEQSEYTPLLVGAKVAAGMLSIGSRTLWSLTKCNAVPSRKIGRAIRYCPNELQAWIAAGCPTEPGSAKRARKGIGYGKGVER